jgi:hypothetical protein
MWGGQGLLRTVEPRGEKKLKYLKMEQHNFQFCYAAADLFCKLQIGYMFDILKHLYVDLILLYPTGLEVEVFGMIQDWLLKWRAVHLLNRKVVFTNDS